MPGVQPPSPTYGSSPIPGSLAVAEKPRRRVGKVATPSVAGRVQIKPAMVHDAPVSGTKLEAVDDEVAAEVQRHGKRLIDVTAGRGDRERLGHRDDDVGLAELPAVMEFRHRRQVGGVAFGAAISGPALEDALSRAGKVGEPREKRLRRNEASTEASGRSTTTSQMKSARFAASL